MKKTLILVVLFALCFGLNALTATKATWTTSQETVNGQDFFIAYTSTAVTTAARVVYTEPTDFKLNWDAPIIVIVNPDADTYDAATLPVTMYCGYSDDFSLVVGTTGTPTLVDGWLYGNILADVQSTTGQFRMFGMPNTLADGTGFAFVAPCTELAFEITAAVEFSASTIEIIIMQPTNLNIPADWHKTYKQEAYK